MISHSLWIVGPSRSGKTTRLVEEFVALMQDEKQFADTFYTKNQEDSSGDRIPKAKYFYRGIPGVLVLAANEDNRRELVDKIITRTSGKYPIKGKTLLGFIQDEIILFWPLLTQVLNLKAQFPVRLRPETELELATKLWRSHLDEEIIRGLGGNEARCVRRLLDFLLLAAYNDIPCEEIAQIIEKGLVNQEITAHLDASYLQSLLLEWREWCLQRGLLSYGIIVELYGQQLLSLTQYQQHLIRRYQGIIADDVDEYPGISRKLFDFLLDQGARGAFSYNPDGGIRLGLGADPDYIEGLAGRCQIEKMSIDNVYNSSKLSLYPLMLEVMESPLLNLPDTVYSIQTTSRGELLRHTTEEIAKAIKDKQVDKNEIAIIAPGLDPIARYTIIDNLNKEGIYVNSLNYQSPLIHSPTIRALLTVLAFVYPGLGRLVDRDTIAEMLVVLSKKQGNSENYFSLTNEIDPVRAGLIADYCFVPHPDKPRLLSANAFDRWDRLGYGATMAYEEIIKWLEDMRVQQEQRLIANPIILLDRAIQKFLWNGCYLPYDQLEALRELLETAQHYWEIDSRVRQTPSSASPPQEKETFRAIATISEFIQLLRRGTITAKPYPLHPIGPASNAVTLATIFQYRSSRKFHRWQFWLDVGSHLWAKGGSGSLFGSNFFIKNRLGQPWTAEDEQEADNKRLRKILGDLLSRTSERIYLCHSELAVNGQEQLGPLLPLANACIKDVADSLMG